MSLLAMPAHREGWVNEGVEVDALHAFADECQAHLAAQVVGQLFGQKVAHLQLRLFYPQGEEQIESKLLISVENMTILSGQLTDSGIFVPTSPFGATTR
jgi:hypothetical protein